MRSFERASMQAAPGRVASAGVEGRRSRRCATSCGVPSLPYAAIVDYIGANLARRILVDELAAIASLSVFQLTRAFRREHRTTPYQLVLDMRIRDAMVSLERGASIAEAAMHAGFSDQSHFTRHFRRLTGTTPKQYAAGCGMRAASRDAAHRAPAGRAPMRSASGRGTAAVTS